MVKQRTLFFLMFSTLLLLNLNFTVLRSIRNTLTVVDLGSGSHLIPFFELFGALPGALLMTWGLSKLMNRFSAQKVFFITLAIFVGFFVVFVFGLYPLLAIWKQKQMITAQVLQLFSMAFFVMAELWKPALAVILFWGLINQHLPVMNAKKLYAPLMLGASLGAVAAGPFVSFCTSETTWRLFPLSALQWTHALNLMTVLMVALSALTAFLHSRLCRYFSMQIALGSAQELLSLKESILFCLQHKQLKLLSWTVIADYIAYSLAEVIFLDVLKHKYPASCDYCNYMGQLGLWSGILTAMSALFITPFVIQRCRWVVAALVTPFCVLITEAAFFVFLRGESIHKTWFGWTYPQWLGVIVTLGSLQYCLCRATKYTFLDASKELAFVLMPALEKMKGKLIIDGLCSRLGRAGASALSIGLIQLCGGVIPSSLPTGMIALGLASSWVISTFKLGRLIDKNKVPA